MQVQLKKWGNSAGLRLPQAILAQLQVRENARFDLQVSNRTLILSPIKPKQKYDLKTLLSEMPDLPMVENWDEMADIGAEKI